MTYRRRYSSDRLRGLRVAERHEPIAPRGRRVPPLQGALFDVVTVTAPAPAEVRVWQAIVPPATAAAVLAGDVDALERAAPLPAGSWVALLALDPCRQGVAGAITGAARVIACIEGERSRAGATGPRVWQWQLGDRLMLRDALPWRQREALAPCPRAVLALLYEAGMPRS